MLIHGRTTILLTLSDSFWVERHRDCFAVLDGSVAFVFNEDEMKRC